MIIIKKGPSFNNPKSFYKQGKASSNTQKVQCKSCGKYTNLIPNKSQSTTYYQIGRSTYYSKLEWLYRCCLEFLETHETKIAPDGRTHYTVLKSNKIEHPIAMADRGSRYIDIITDTSKLSNEHLARLIVKANDNSVYE